MTFVNQCSSLSIKYLPSISRQKYFQLDIYISMDTEYLQYGLLVLQRFTQKCSDWNSLFPGCDVFDNYTHMSNKCLVDF